MVALTLNFAHGATPGQHKMRNTWYSIGASLPGGRRSWQCLVGPKRLFIEDLHVGRKIIQPESADERCQP